MSDWTAGLKCRIKPLNEVRARRRSERRCPLKFTDTVPVAQTVAALDVLPEYIVIPALEAVAVILGLAYLLLAIRERRECWIAGGFASVLFLGVFWRAALPMQALLQVYYVGIAIHGWRHWGRSQDATARPVSRVSPACHGVALALWALLCLLTQGLRGDFLHGALSWWDTASREGASLSIDAVIDALAPGWLDTASSWGSVIATWMIARKKLEAWIYWILIDSASAALYLQAGLGASAALYGVYALLAAMAWREWRTSYRRLRMHSSPKSA